ncbi:MAG: GIY-YIG nuclease family protein [bacterium]|nr:GIY-YIG nuclease family protein [bacterium]
MYYTYIIESTTSLGRRYIGHTRDLKKRLSEHNSGKCLATARYSPWKVRLYVAFEDIEHAQRFERYLKSGSGHTFANHHFWN